MSTNGNGVNNVNNSNNNNNNTDNSVSAGGGPGSGPAAVVSGGSVCGSLSSLTGSRKLDLCAACGQFHEPGGTHLYDYSQQVDQDLLCKLCQQPLVDPLDTRCGHTFCTPCLKNHLARQALCPIDKSIINFLECAPASSLVKKLLDKLLVVCPNVDYCEEVLQRSNLEAHLQHRCRGAVTRCSKASRGCTFQGPRTAIQSHLWECPFLSEDEAPPEPDYAANWQPQAPIASGEVSAIEIPRGCCDLGISFVGGCDTPLSCIVIQEIYIDGLVAKDGRLRPGDQILQVDSEDLTQATHCQAKRALSQLHPICRLAVYREPTEDTSDRGSGVSYTERSEVLLKITLSNRCGRKLGIKLVGKKNCPGLYILGLVPGGFAQLDGRLRRDDRILEINGVDLSNATQEEAAAVIQSAQDEVEFLVSRRVASSAGPPPQAPQTPPDVVPRRQSPPAIVDDEATAAAAAAVGTADETGGGGCGEHRDRDENDAVAAACGTPPRAEAEAAEFDDDEDDKCEDVKDVNREDRAAEATEARDDSSSGQQDSPPPPPPAAEIVVQNLAPPPASPSLSPSPPPPPPPAPSAGLAAALESIPSRLVILDKSSSSSASAGGGLGMSVAGGVGSQRGDIPVYVTNLQPDGLAARSRQIRKGDIVLAVNGSLLLGLSHEEAVALLKAQEGSVAVRLLPGPESSSGGGNFMPSWVYWLALPPLCYLEKDVRLRRDPRSRSLGFSIVGGCDSATGPQPIIVKSIVQGGPAHEDGALRCGDLITRVNGDYCLASVTHEEAVMLLKLLHTDTVVLTVVSWPGTIV